MSVKRQDLKTSDIDDRYPEICVAKKVGEKRWVGSEVSEQ